MPRRLSPCRFLLAVMAAALSLSCASISVSAQTNTAAPPAIPRTMPVLPLGQDASYDLGPYIITYPVSGETQTYPQLIAALSAQRQDLKLGQLLVTAGNAGKPFWVAFAVRNSSNAGGWTIDLGGRLEGRSGMADGFFVYDHVSRRMIINTFDKKDGKTPDFLSHGRYIPVDIAPGREALIVMHFAPEAGMPLSMPATLLLNKAALDQPMHIVSWRGALLVFLIAAIGFGLSLAFIRMPVEGLSTALFFAALLASFLTVDTLLVWDWFPVAGAVLPACAVLGALAAIAMTYAYAAGTSARKPLAVACGASAAIVLVTGVVCATPASASFSTLAPDLPLLLALPAAAILSFTFRQNMREDMLFALGWVVVAAGTAITAMGKTGAIETGLLSLNAIYFMLPLSGLLFLAAFHLKQGRVMDRLARHKSISSERLQALTALKSAKDNADYSNLLKVIEHERKLLIAAREREAQRIEEMRLAKVAADDANAAKSAFLAVISHEIRTPMTGVMGMVRLLLDTQMNKEQTEYAKTIQESGNAMMSLLNDILDFEKIESGRMQLEQVVFDLPRLIGSVINLMQGQASQKNIYLKAEIEDKVPSYVVGDPARLRQVLLNLVGNGIKFTPKGGVTVHVRLTPAEQKADSADVLHEIYFAIQDSGVGIPKGAEKSIFSPFSQADASITRKFGGTGLGLAICKRLVDAMGSAINVSSKEGEGTTFFFSLLMKEGSADAAEEMFTGTGKKETLTEPQRILKILVVDDNAINLRVITGLIDRKGHLSATASSGEEALQKITGEAFDAVFMDIRMSGMNGLDATREIRQMSDLRAATTPVVALTGNVSDDDVNACYEAGMNDFIAKPINPDHFDNVLIRIQTGNFQQSLKGVAKREPALSAADIAAVEAARAADFAGAPVSLQTMPDNAPLPPAPAQAPEVPVETMPPLAAMPTGFALEDDAPKPVSTVQVTADDDESLPAVLRYAKQLETGNRPAAAVTTAAVPPAAAFTLDDKIRPFDTGTVTTLKTALKPKDLAELVDGFLAKAEEIIGTLKTASQHGLTDTIRDKAHEMKGMAGNFGLMRVSHISGHMEKEAKEGSKADFTALIAMLEKEYAQAKAEISAWLAE